MDSSALGGNSDRHAKSLASNAEELAEVASYVKELGAKPCQSVELPAGKGLRYRCTWGCMFSTDSREDWLQHEVEKQPQRIWHCASCRRARRSTTGSSVYITHSRRDIFDHAKLQHGMSSDDRESLVRGSEVLEYDFAPPQCLFTLNNQRTCHHLKFATWEQRNDHYIRHFDWWWDRIWLATDQQKHLEGEKTNVRKAQAIQLESLHAMSVQPRRTFGSTDAGILEVETLPVDVITDILAVFASSGQIMSMIKEQIEPVARAVLRAIDHSEILEEEVKARISAMTLPLLYCVYLIQSRGSPLRELKQIVQGLLEVLIWWEIDYQLEAIKAFHTDSSSHETPLSDLRRIDAATVLSEPRHPRDSGTLYSDPADDREYSWLLSVAKQGRCMTLSQCYALPCKSFMTSLYRQILCDPREVHHLYAKIDWSPLFILSDESTHNAPEQTLASTITLSGPNGQEHASTCAEYVNGMWPHFGSTVIQCMQGAASSDLGTFSISQKDMELTVDCTPTRTVVDASGLAVALLETFECAAWLGAACRPSPRSDNISCIETNVKSGDGGFLSFDIEYTCTTVESHDDQASDPTCWQDMFRNPVIAGGYPVPLREANEQGLEVSVPLLTTLGQTYWATTFNGFLLKGFNSLMVPVKRIGNSVIWHFKVSKDGDRMPYTDGHQTSSAFHCYSDAIFPGARHFVGWTNAESTAGKLETLSPSITAVTLADTVAHRDYGCRLHQDQSKSDQIHRRWRLRGAHVDSPRGPVHQCWSQHTQSQQRPTGVFVVEPVREAD